MILGTSISCLLSSIGDGINVAVRLQALAAPGGIACSAAVRHEVGNKPGLDFE
ncbi:hypothetical protein FML87_07465 [Rhizobium leguminosarum bv. phaseoli]|nr:hypothetical protein [Rhizobium leguminosarum bv. phaseoli]